MADPRINLLSQETASKIAAGEVVEKPASVVKELVENAIDAEAKAITVEILNGGLDLIRIIDDGTGILNEDIGRAFKPHATSKIKNIDDIFAISSLGFRGEALPSVAAVSRTLLKSHSNEDEDGMEIFVEGGEEKFQKYSALDQGTIVEVKDLFFNVPARLKFLRSSQKEGSNVTDIMTRLALSRPDIAFTYYNNEKLIFRTYGTGKLIDVIRTVYTRKIADHSSWFEREMDGLKISGYIGNEEIARKSRNQQTIFINGRYVVSRSITAAVEQAFKSFITINKFPFFVLSLEVDWERVDVNVHPQKAEVKFSDDRAMFKAVFDTVHGALRQIYQDRLGFEESLEEGLSHDGPGSPPHHQLPGDTNVRQHSFFGEESEEKPSAVNAADPLRSAFSRNGFSPDPESGPETGSPSSSLGRGMPSPPVNVKLPVDLRSGARQSAAGDRAATDFSPEERNTKVSESQPGEYTAPGEAMATEAEAKFPMPFIIGQFKKTYILAELNDTLYLIDQHAAHEKINFERYMEEMLSRELVLQPLLIPEVVDLPMDDYSVYLDNQEIFQAAGFAIEEFGDRSLNIREVPMFLSSVSAQRYFGEILDNLKNLGKGSAREIRYLRIATVACKASVKAHDELTMAEMQHLINELRFLNEPFTCPHGRPTMIRFTKTEIEKMFRRIQ